MKSLAGHGLCWTFALLVALPLALAQPGAIAQERGAFSQAELDQLLAPVALYPDPLLSQMLMAATYPLEVVEAARWSKARPGLQGDEAVKAAASEDWDPSVKSLLAFPQVLAWMDENLQWTRSVGDAFLAQEPQVMETVQGLRARAQAAGTLRSDERVHVTEEGRAIVVYPADPQVIYVPYYDPVVVYGRWWWPAHPPVHWRPWPGYRARPGYVSAFHWGPGIAVSAGFFFGAFDWQRRHVRVAHVNNYYYNTVTVSRHAEPHRPGTVTTVNRAPGAWQHNPEHRRGAAYRDATLQRRFAAPAPSAPQQRQPSSAPAQVERGRIVAPAQRETRQERRIERRREEEPRESAPPAAAPRRGAPVSPGARPEFRRDPGSSAPVQVEPGRVVTPAQRETREERRSGRRRTEERRESAPFSEAPRGTTPLPPSPGALPPLPGALPPSPGARPQPRRDWGSRMEPRREQSRHAEHRPRIEARQEPGARATARPAERPAARAPDRGARPAEGSRRRQGEKRPA